MILTKTQFNQRLNLKADMINIEVENVKGRCTEYIKAGKSLFVLSTLKICYKNKTTQH